MQCRDHIEIDRFNSLICISRCHWPCTQIFFIGIFGRIQCARLKWKDLFVNAEFVGCTSFELTMCWLASHLKTASCSSSRMSGGTVPISVALFMSNVRFKNKYRSNKCASSSVDTNENAVPCRPARAHRPWKFNKFFLSNKIQSDQSFIYKIEISLTNSMHKQFWFAWKMNVDHIVKWRDIDTTSRNVSDNQNRNFIQAKPSRVDFPCRCIHARINECICDFGLIQHLKR